MSATTSISSTLSLPIIHKIPMEHFDKLPKELVNAKRWLNWKWEIKDGKLTKVPVNNMKAYRVSVTDPDNWLDFYDALGNHHKSLPRLGVGFVMGSGFCGVDFDHCIDNGITDPKVLSILREFDSYREISPSGTGVKMIIKGSLPRYHRDENDTVGKTKNKRKDYVPGVDIEFYDRARFFTVTCNGMGELRETQQELEKLHAEIFGTPDTWAVVRESGESTATCPLDDDELIEEISRSAQGDKFDQLWEGDASEYNGDKSAADMALASILSFWVGNDPQRIVELIKNSGLGEGREEKYEREDYLPATVEKALDNTPTFKKWCGEEDDDSPSDALLERIDNAPETSVEEVPTEEVPGEEIVTQIMTEGPAETISSADDTPETQQTEESLYPEWYAAEKVFAEERKQSLLTLQLTTEPPPEPKEEPIETFGPAFEGADVLLKSVPQRYRVNSWLDNPPKEITPCCGRLGQLRERVL